MFDFTLVIPNAVFRVTLKHLLLGYGTKIFAKATVLAAGKQIRCSLKSVGGSHELKFMDELTLREGESVTVTLAG